MKAVALYSGGLDSILAIKLIQEQGIDVHAIYFVSPFFGTQEPVEHAKKLGIKLKVVDAGQDYIKILKNPKHGYGKNFNPCIDCKIFMFRKARQYAKQIGAKFIFTGEVLGERPMSQNRSALHIIERDAGLKGKLLRPLSAKLLNETEAEKKGYVDRNRLLEINGRGREGQFELAKKYGLKEYPTPAGGCLLTFSQFAQKAKDLLKNKKILLAEEFLLLKFGRHFRFGKNKIIVGRHEKDNEKLIIHKNKADYLFEPKDIPGPTTILQGRKTKEAIVKAAALTARYSDANGKDIEILYGKKLEKKIKVSPMKEEEIRRLMIIQQD